uniref:Putative LOC101892441 [Musca domestica] n=1 Tax=Lepeophtheirus salmonis TaxID=72036 RepID=A0A0K2T9C9_LEPSM
MIPVGRKALPGSGKDEKGTWAFIKTLYSNEYRWSVVKSIGLFLFGIYLSKEVKEAYTNPQPLS